MSKKNYNLPALEKQAEDLRIKVQRLQAQLVIVETTIAKAKAQANFELTQQSQANSQEPQD